MWFRKKSDQERVLQKYHNLLDQVDQIPAPEGFFQSLQSKIADSGTDNRVSRFSKRRILFAVPTVAAVLALALFNLKPIFFPLKHIHSSYVFEAKKIGKGPGGTRGVATLSTDHKVLKLVEMAEEIERNGAKFYRDNEHGYYKDI